MSNSKDVERHLVNRQKEIGGAALYLTLVWERKLKDLKVTVPALAGGAKESAKPALRKTVVKHDQTGFRSFFNFLS